jgi:maleate isomerase
MAGLIRLGILTPSSNTSLEPLTQAIISQLPNVSVHFSRFTVVKISLDDDGLGQFQTEKIVEAATLLADANVDMIGWSGTSSGWLGFQADKMLCEAITAATGIPATTSVLALNRAARGLGIKELGLVTPYTDDVQSAIIKTYATIGVDCSKEKHLGLSKNSAFAEVTESLLDEMVASVAARDVKAISTFCTNLYAAQRASFWEDKYDIVVLDTVVTVIWDMLRHCGVDTTTIKGWGRLLSSTSSS